MQRPSKRVSNIVRGSALVMALSILPATAGTNLLYILDASNSMWGQGGSKSKIDIARQVMKTSLAALPTGVNAGLMLYGHRRRNDCSDVELVAPIGAATRAQLSGVIQTLSPRGKTPIATALERAGKAFEGRLEDKNAVLLISDGIETCGGNPCDVAQKLAKRGINLRINVVGLVVNKKARAQLECIAKAGNGQYFDARNAGDFKVALAKVQKQVAKAPPPPAAPKALPKPKPKGPVVYFTDEFNGSALSPDWEVLRTNPDNYLVEDGVLTLVAHDGTKMGVSTGTNVLRLKKPLPKGDWRMTVRLFYVPQTFGEQLWLGLARENGDGIYAQMRTDTVNYNRTNLNLRGEKISRGKASGFAGTPYYITGRNLKARADFFAANVAAIDLQLVKKGRKYTARMRLEARDGASAPPAGTWTKVQDLSSLKAPGDNLVLGFGGSSSIYLPHDGEGVIAIDRVRIETP